MAKIQSSIGSVGSPNSSRPENNEKKLRQFVVDDESAAPSSVGSLRPSSGFTASSTDFDDSMFRSIPDDSMFRATPAEQPAPVREISVQEYNDIRENIKRLHGQRVQAIESNQKSLIERLIGMGIVYEDVPVSSPVSDKKTIFRIKTLNSREKTSVTRAHAGVQLSSDAHKVEAILEARDTTLVYALHSIDGISVTNLLNCSSDTEENRFFYIKEFISSLDNNLLNYLYNKFTDLEKRNERFYLDNFSNAEDIADAMKKSQ